MTYILLDPFDYIGLSSSPLTFIPLGPIVVCENITINDDAEFEDSENFLFFIDQMQADRAIAVVSPNSSLVTINDPEDGKKHMFSIECGYI